MASTGLQIFGLSLALIGWIGAIVCCVLPVWSDTGSSDSTVTTWEGLWMKCERYNTGKMNCEVYDTVLGVKQYIQVGRALTVITIILGILGIFAAIFGGKCTTCVEDGNVKAKICIASGIIFIICGVLLLIPVSWTANIIIQNYHNPHVPEPYKMELGASLYIGWAGAVLLLIGGGLLCCNCPKRDVSYAARYNANNQPESKCV